MSITAEQLATLAARLARNENDKPDSLIQKAWQLWYEADKFLLPERERLYREIEEEERDAQEAIRPALPKPTSYPVTRDEFARLMLPHLKGRTGELAAALKDYIRYSLKNHLTKQKVTPEVAYGQWKPINDPDSFERTAMRFLSWWQRHHSKQVSEARSNAARKSVEKRAATAEENAKKPSPQKKLKKKL